MTTMALPRFVNVSVDLDGIDCYHQIHSLGPVPPTASIYRDAMPRLLELFAELGVRATFFVIARDLDTPGVADALERALDEGHEIASHSYHHPYNLRDWSRPEILEEVTLAHETIQGALGVEPVGFRVPGYNVDNRILSVLNELDYRYDSSVFPCPAYYAAKGAVMGWMALRGKKSGSSMTHPAALLAPLQPYQPSRTAFERPGSVQERHTLWEIPIGVVPGARAPVIGTSVGALSPTLARALAKTAGFSQPTFQLELHAVDLMDSGDAGISPAFVARQPDLRRAWQKKRAALAAFVQEISRDRELLTLADAVDRLDAAGQAG